MLEAYLGISQWRVNIGYASIVIISEPHRILEQIAVKLQNLLDDPSVRILLYVGRKGEVRYIEIQNNVKLSRSTINAVIHNLEERKLIDRRITPTKPIQVHYSITQKGKDTLGHFERLRELIL
jgi:DNA-binding HxlR family transcriptional regulator